MKKYIIFVKNKVVNNKCDETIQEEVENNNEFLNDGVFLA
jgi:hypothetical protein